MLDTQECVKMDVAIAAFTKYALQFLTHELLAGRIELPDHGVLVADFHETIRDGSRARVRAPHLCGSGPHSVRQVLTALLAGARNFARSTDAGYLGLAESVIESGSLAERIRQALQPHTSRPTDEFIEAARRIYIELADCLEANDPWRRRWG